MPCDNCPDNYRVSKPTLESICPRLCNAKAESVVGPVDGSWGGGGITPTHPSAWCKANQGWVKVQTLTDGVVTLEDVKTSKTVYKVPLTGNRECPIAVEVHYQLMRCLTHVVLNAQVFHYRA